MDSNDTVKDGYEVVKRGEQLCVDLWYPPRGADSEGRVRSVQLGLVDVRAADDIRISYDFDRDGWVVKQQVSYEVEGGSDPGEVEEWREVAFIQAWGLMVPKSK